MHFFVKSSFTIVSLNRFMIGYVRRSIEMTIAEKIKESRLKLGLTQQEVSEKLFVTRQTISNWENNRSTPDIDTLIKLSDLYQIDLESLLKPEQLAEEPEIKIEEKKKTFRLPLYLLNLTTVVACVFTDFFTPTGTMTLWTVSRAT